MSDQSLELMKPEGGAVARPQAAVLSIAQAYEAVTSGKLNAESLAVMKELLAMDAERQFAVAFVALQAELRTVKATRIVPNNDGTPRYKFAPFEEIMAEVGPKAEKHGFTITFSTDFAEGRLVKSCTLQHIAGHSRTNKFAVRVGQGPPKASECQADGAASTYAKRFALCDALNIQIDHDSDANVQGTPITPEQAADLDRRVKSTGSDRELFLRLAGAKTFTEIMSGRYDDLAAALAKRERIQQAKADADLQRRINEGKP